MSITLILLIIAIAVAVYLILNATKDKTDERANRGTYVKLFLAGFIASFFLVFWLIPNTYYIKFGFGLFAGIFGGIASVIRIPQGWDYARKQKESTEANSSD